jgi:hypothetical protein
LGGSGGQLEASAGALDACNYLAESTAHSIYRIRGQWPVNWRWRGGGRREGGALAQRIGGLHRGKVTSGNEYT